MIPPRLHATLDAVSAAALLAASASDSLRAPVRGPVGALGLAVAAYSLATRYERGGGNRPIPMHIHRLLDAAQGAACLALARKAHAPAARGFLRGYGLFSLAAAALSSPPGPRGVDLPPEAVTSARVLGPDLAYLRCGIVNVAFIGPAGTGDGGWFLVDAAIAGSAAAIRAAARKRFGTARPAAILLTHGHFDHVGALEELARHWEVPIYAHPDEHPFLTGRQAYPPAAPEVGGGAMAELSFLFPRKPLDVSDRLRRLPEDGSIPGLPGWRWLATPGHSPGHVSFWNERRRTLVAGDAVVSTQQESLLASLLGKGRLQGPPSYFTPDWAAAERSVRRLAKLQPEVVLTGHGPALSGHEVPHCLDRLVEEFDRLALPHQSRYLRKDQSTFPAAP